MGRAKKVLEKLEENAYKKGLHSLPRAAQQQSTGSAVDVSAPTIIQPGTTIQGVGIVADAHYTSDGQSVQVRYTVVGDSTAMSSGMYAGNMSMDVPVTSIYPTMNNEEYMRLRITDVLRSDQYRESTLIQQVAAHDVCDISTLVDALAQCETTLRTVYALTRIAGEIGDVDYPRLVQSLRTLIMDESGVEPDAQPWSTPLVDSDGRGSSSGDGLLKIYEKNGASDHMVGLNGRIVCPTCHRVNLASNSQCGECQQPFDRYTPVQYAQEMYGTFSDPLKTCTQCGTAIEDKAYTCRRCGVSVYISPVMNVKRGIMGGLRIPCMQCKMPNEIDADACVQCGGKVGIDCRQCGQQNSAEWKSCMHCSGALQIPMYNTETCKECTQCGRIQGLSATRCERCGHTGFLVDNAVNRAIANRNVQP